jgi:carboxyl-terminal processing protease
VESEKSVSAKPKNQSKKGNVLKTLGVTLAAGVIFLSGLGVGSGRIVLNKDQLFRKSIQKTDTTDLDYASVEQVYDILRKDYDGQLDTEKVLDGIKSGLASAAGDPYTEYLNKKEAQDFDSQLNGTFSGIGAELGKDTQNNIVVISPIAGFPAEKAGLKAQDIIVEVDGESIAGKTIGEAVGKIRGEKGTNVKLKLVRNKSQEVNLDITRDTITIPSVDSKILDGNIGYLKITRFGEDTVSLANKAAANFKAKGVKGVILDVRNDPGGLLDAAVGVSSIWLDSGKTVLQEKRDGKVIRSYNSKGGAILKGIKTVVLINEGSASASEIVAGALHDNGAATLIGVKSYGKGSVQQLESLGDGSVLKVTIARWFTPNGVNIDKEGIKPDTEIKLSEEDFKSQRDPQLETAKTSL